MPKQPVVAAVPEPVKSKRIISLDAFRGLTVAMMIYMNYPVDPKATPWYLIHPKWDGFTLADTIFPAFIFIAGVSMALFASTRAGQDQGATKTFYRRILILILIGLAFNLLKYELPLRIPGVLQRIAVASAIAWPLRKSKTWKIITLSVVFVTIHTLVLKYVGAPGVTLGAVAQDGNISGWIDRQIFGIYTYNKGGFDPEGVLGQLTATAQILWGLLVGRAIVNERHSWRPLWIICGIAVVAILVGAAMAGWMPINKKLWNAPFTLISFGTAALAFMAMYAGDLKEKTRWMRSLTPLGMNALFLYIVSGALVSVMHKIPVITPSGREIDLYRAGGAFVQDLVGRTPGTLLYSGLQLALFMLIAEWMFRRKIFVKL